MAETKKTYFSTRILKSILPTLVLVLGLLFIARPVFAVTNEQLLEGKLKKARAANNMDEVAATYELLLSSGYKTKERYKALGDLYFYIKKDEEALRVFKEQANWLNTEKEWETYSDLLLWKKKVEEGLSALQNAVKLDPENQTLYIKLLNLFEFHKQIEHAENLWKGFYQENDKSLIIGEQFIAFYLRNGKVHKARELYEELISLHGQFQTVEKKLGYLKVLIWSGKIHSAYAELVKIPVKDLPEKELEYLFTLSLSGGNTQMAEDILDRIEQTGKETWLNRLKISTILGDPEYTRSLVENEIDEKGETLPLLILLFETYRSELDIDNMLEMQGKILTLDYKNPKWVNALMSHYLYSQEYDEGIDLFEDIIDEVDDADLVKYNLAILYRENDEYDDFEEILDEIEDQNLELAILNLKLQHYQFLDDSQKIYDICLEILPFTPKEAPEELLLTAQKAKAVEETEYHHNEGGTGEKDETIELWDGYVDLLQTLTSYAEIIGLTDKITEHGRTLYNTLKSRYAKYPTKKRLYGLVASARFASAKEQEEDLLIGKNQYKDFYFQLQYFRFLHKQKRKDEADDVFAGLLEQRKNIRDRKMNAEHTFGLVSYGVSKSFFTELLKEDPKYYMGLKRLGQIGLYTKDYETAATNFEEYLKINRFDTEILFSQGEVFNILREYGKIEDNMESAVEILLKINRTSGENERLALCYIRLEEFENAFGAINDALKQNPDGISLKLNRLEILRMLERWQELLDYAKLEDLETHDKLLVGLNIFTAYSALGDEEDALQKLEELYKLYPRDKDVVSTLAYFKGEHGYDLEALRYFEEAYKLPPLNRELNQDYRGLKRRYSDMVEINLNQTESTDSKSTSAQLHAGLMVGKTDHLELTAENYQGEIEQTGESIEKDIHYFSYFGKLTGRQKYDIHLTREDKLGIQLTHQSGFAAFLTKVTLDVNVPKYDSVTLASADTYQTGYTLELVFQNIDWRQDYTLGYAVQDYDYKNEGTFGESNEVTQMISFSQSFLKYPHQAKISLTNQTKKVSGDATALFLDHSENSGSLFYEYNWSQFFKTGIEAFFGEDSEVNSERSGGLVTAEFRGDSLSFLLGYQEQKELTTPDLGDDITNETTIMTATINYSF
jgi:predicted Zn-dependent protease